MGPRSRPKEYWLVWGMERNDHNGSCLFNVRLGEGSGSLILLMVDRRRKSSLERTIDEHSKIDELFAENKEAKQRPRT